MIKLTKELDVYLGEEFLNMAKVHGGYYYNDELKSELGSIPQSINVPHYVLVVMDGHEFFPQKLLSEFQKKFASLLKPEIDMVVSDFQLVDQPDLVISKYELDKLKFRGDKILEHPEPGNFLVSIELEMSSEAQVVENIKDAIKKALYSTKFKKLPYTYLGCDDSDGRRYYLFKFFGTDDKDLGAIADEIGGSLASGDFTFCRCSDVEPEAGKISSCTYRAAEKIVSNLSEFNGKTIIG